MYKIRSLNHQEIYLIHPSPPPKNKSDSNLDQKVIEEIHKNYKQKLQNPYHKIKIGNSKKYSHSFNKKSKEEIIFSKSDENWSVVVISDAEKLCSKSRGCKFIIKNIRRASRKNPLYFNIFKHKPTDSNDSIKMSKNLF